MGTYAKAFEIPEGFPAILREFAKEAIREQPDDIYRFGSEYFDKLSAGNVKELFTESIPAVPGDVDSKSEGSKNQLGIIPFGVNKVETEEAAGSQPAPSPMFESLPDRIGLLFQEADTDGNGTLSRMEFQQVLALLGADIGLEEKHIMQIMAEADNNDDGVIEYKEFLPVSMEIIKTIMAKEQYTDNKVLRKKRTSAKLDVKDFLVKGLPRDELEETIQKIFRGADEDGSGALDRQEFVRCLKESGLGFTRQELNLILTLIDKNGDGVIDYEEFMPVCFSLIVETLSTKVQQVPEEEVTLREHVHGLLLKANGNNKHLVSSAASDCLLNAGLGLRFVQVPAIMSAVEEGVDGMVAAEEVASAVAGVMCALKQLDTRQRESPEDETVSKFKAARQVMCLVKIGGFDADEFKDKLEATFKSKDDGDTGVLPTKDAIRDAIKEALPELEARQVHALGSLAEQKEDGRWGFKNIPTWGFRTLQEIQDQNILIESLKVTNLGG